MTKEQALSVIKEVCAKVQADLATHQTIQTAIQVLEREFAVAVVGEEKKK